MSAPTPHHHQPPLQPPAPPQPPKKSSTTGVLIALGAVAVVVAGAIGLGVLVLGSGSETRVAATTTATTTSTKSAAELSAEAAAASASAQAFAQARAAKLDKSTYQAVSSRDWQLVAKSPDTHVGDKYVIYGVVTQADSATGAYAIRVSTDGQQVESYDYDINTIANAGEASFSQVVEDDIVAMWVEVAGSETYDTTMGGSTTAPKVTVNVIEVVGHRG